LALTSYLETITNKLIKTIKIDIKKLVYNLTKQITYKLKATPDVRTDEEIKSTCIIINAYVKDDANPPTHSNTPLPIPICNYQEMEYENLNHIAEADNLLIFMNFVPPVKKTTLFVPLIHLKIK
jgi:hypothetical protein